MDQKIVYDGWLKVAKIDTPQGPREKLITFSAVAALVYSVDGKILLVKQYRSAVEKECWEIPAGCLDVTGESEYEGLLRELKEEADIDIKNVSSVIKFAEYHPMLGASDYKMHLYEIKTDASAIDKEITDDADVTAIKWVTLKDLRNMITAGEIQDGKTTMASYHALISQIQKTAFYL
jgi:ADP-ribose pyrophosphatase